MTRIVEGAGNEQHDLVSNEFTFTNNNSMQVVDLGHGLIFKGNIKQGVPSGFGYIQRQWDGLLIYKGKFKNGVFNGFGIFHDEDGGQYEGEFINGSYHGYGQITFLDGSKHSGKFVHGRRHGPHILWNPNTQKLENKEYNHGAEINNQSILQIQPDL